MKPILRGPAHREGVALVQHPLPVHVVVDLGREVDDARVVAEILACGQRAAHQDRGIDGGEFTVPDAPSGPPVDEVVVEPFVAFHVVENRAQCDANPLTDGAGRKIAA